MTYDEFFSKVKSNLSIGKVLLNPGGGTSKILSFTENNVTYQRGKSPIPISIKTLYELYEKYSGTTVSSTDLKEYLPKVFDSKHNGHSCNCTFFFMVMKEMGVIQRIRGDGKAHHPFYVDLPAKN
jgi:hypothetical protein